MFARIFPGLSKAVLVPGLRIACQRVGHSIMREMEICLAQSLTSCGNIMLFTPFPSLVPYLSAQLVDLSQVRIKVGKG